MSDPFRKRNWEERELTGSWFNWPNRLVKPFKDESETVFIWVHGSEDLNEPRNIEPRMIPGQFSFELLSGRTNNTGARNDRKNQSKGGQADLD